MAAILKGSCEQDTYILGGRPSKTDGVGTWTMIYGRSICSNHYDITREKDHGDIWFEVQMSANLTYDSELMIGAIKAFPQAWQAVPDELLGAAYCLNCYADEAPIDFELLKALRSGDTVSEKLVISTKSWDGGYPTDTPKAYNKQGLVVTDPFGRSSSTDMSVVPTGKYNRVGPTGDGKEYSHHAWVNRLPGLVPSSQPTPEPKASAYSSCPQQVTTFCQGDHGSCPDDFQGIREAMAVVAEIDKSHKIGMLALADKLANDFRQKKIADGSYDRFVLSISGKPDESPVGGEDVGAELPRQESSDTSSQSDTSTPDTSQD